MAVAGAAYRVAQPRQRGAEGVLVLLLHDQPAGLFHGHVIEVDGGAGRAVGLHAQLHAAGLWQAQAHLQGLPGGGRGAVGRLVVVEQHGALRVEHAVVQPGNAGGAAALGSGVVRAAAQGQAHAGASLRAQPGGGAQCGQSGRAEQAHEGQRKRNRSVRQPAARPGCRG